MEKVTGLNDYQRAAMTTCTESSRNFSYMMLNLVGEVGEFASKVAKAIRKEKCTIEGNRLFVDGSYPLFQGSMTDDEIEDLKREDGDCLWQLSGLCTVMGWSLEDVANDNLCKLASRKERGVIVGNGDNR